MNSDDLIDALLACGFSQPVVADILFRCIRQNVSFIEPQGQFARHPVTRVGIKVQYGRDGHVDKFLHRSSIDTALQGQTCPCCHHPLDVADLHRQSAAKRRPMADFIITP